MMVPQWGEKRRHPRYHVCCPISFMFFDELRFGETANLSMGGMKIQCRAMLLTGEIYEFTVVINGRAIHPRGKIVYLHSQPEFTYGAGVSFIQISKDHRGQLTRFLAAQTPG